MGTFDKNGSSLSFGICLLFIYTYKSNVLCDLDSVECDDSNGIIIVYVVCRYFKITSQSVGMLCRVCVKRFVLMNMNHGLV